MDKSNLHWASDADRVPEQALGAAPDPPKRTAPQPAQRTTTMPRSTEAKAGSTFGIGPAVPAGEIDWAARRPSANSESSAISIPAGSDAVGTESHTPPQRRAPSPGAALVGALIFVLLTLWTMAARAFCSGKRHRLPPSRLARQRTVRLRSSVPKLQPIQSTPQPRANHDIRCHHRSTSQDYPARRRENHRRWHLGLHSGLLNEICRTSLASMSPHASFTARQRTK